MRKGKLSYTELKVVGNVIVSIAIKEKIMFKKVKDIKGDEYYINLKRVQYFQPMDSGKGVKIKFPTYVIIVPSSEWDRLQPFVSRL